MQRAVDSGTQVLELGSGAWCGDFTVPVQIPDDWTVEIHWPATPPELTDEEILASLRRPVGQAPIRDLVAGCTQPVILVDDLTRPTPLDRVLPLVLAELEAAGIRNEAVTIVMATGTHGAPGLPGAFAKKVGELAASRCQLRVHDHLRDVVRVGRTSFGTPVLVDRHVASADYVIGVGGIYPQHTTWFGGGSKLVLGVLGERSIANLHYRHWSLNARYALDNEFRQDLNEVAILAGLRTSVAVHVDARRRPVRVTAGDPKAFYAEAARYSAEAFRAPPPGDADVVVCNAYPMDVSLTAACTKGTIPFKHASPTASRLLVAACPEGNGHHGLFPFVDVPRYHYRIQRLRRQLIGRDHLVQKARSELRRLRPSGAPASAAQSPEPWPIHMFRPVPDAPEADAAGAGITISPTWADLLAYVKHEQGAGRRLRAVVYPCAPLQTLDLPGRLT